MEIENITDHYHERMQRILLFAPLYRLERKEVERHDGTMMSCMGLGLLALLFFFENMLVRNRNVGVRELAVFLREATQGVVSLDDAGFEKTARMIVAAFRPSSGRRNEVGFFNWEVKREEKLSYSILKAHKSDLGTNAQYYVLDEQGLELIFATKEYFSEFQLSINQLILRKQLEKGEFALALRQIEEMRLDVCALSDRIARIGNEIHRNIVSEETLERYKRIVGDINLRMKLEDQEFRELKEFVRATRRKLGDNMATDLDRRAYENIIDVDRELNDVHLAHRGLLKLAIDLKTAALTAAEESLYFTGVELFNFQQELTNKMFAAPLPVQAARTLVEPFLPIERKTVWSPLTVFGAQRLETEAQEAPVEAFPDVTAEAGWERREIASLQEKYLLIMRLIAAALGEAREITLKSFIAYLAKTEEAGLLESKQFYLFWIFLHRKSPFVFADKEISDKSAFYQVVQSMPAIRQIVVRELPEVLTVREKYKISDMRLTVEAQ